MKCPACFNSLAPLTIGRLTVDVCRSGCGGIWFDAFELQQVDEPHETASEWLLRIERDPALHVDLARKRQCPKCDSVKLQRHHFSAKRRVEVDECPGCGGCWLDAGELEKIREELDETTLEKETRIAERTQISAPVLRYIYRMRTNGRV